MKTPAIQTLAITLALGAAAPALADPSHGASEEGLASFYGKAFEGEETASGETFDPDELTAASAKHPPGTMLEVTNVENSKSVRVRVNDHGPAKQERREGVIIDLSRAAAKRLAFTDEGKAKVRVQVVQATDGPEKRK